LRGIKELGVGGAAAYTFLESYLYKNHRVVTDSWFVSPNLAEFLHERGTQLIGTAQNGRKNMPKISGKLPKNTVETYATDKILVERYAK